MSVWEVPAVEAVCDQCSRKSPTFTDEKALTESLTAGDSWLIRPYLVLCPACKESSA